MHVFLQFSHFCFAHYISDNSIIEPKMSASFVPDHKAPMVLFLDRVYGIDNQDFLLHVLEVGFLPDMRAAASLDTVRYILYFFSLAKKLSVIAFKWYKTHWAVVFTWEMYVQVWLATFSVHNCLKFCHNYYTVLTLRPHSALQKWPWHWTGTCALQCFFLSLNVLLYLLARTTVPSWSTPCSTQSTGCPEDALLPKLREMLLRNASCLCAGECYALQQRAIK